MKPKVRCVSRHEWGFGTENWKALRSHRSLINCLASVTIMFIMLLCVSDSFFRFPPLIDFVVWLINRPSLQLVVSNLVTGQVEYSQKTNSISLCFNYKSPEKGILKTLLGLGVPLVRSAMDHSFLAAHSVSSEGTRSLRWGIDRFFKRVSVCKQNDWLSQFMSLNVIGD